MVISFTKEDILGGPLDREQYALLSTIDRLDLGNHHEENKYVRPLIFKRLQEIEEERRALGLSESDPTPDAEAEGEIEASH